MKKIMSRLSEIPKWFKNKQNHPPVENEPCKNCKTVFSGYYCPECGQSEKEFNRPFSIVFYDFLGNVFAFDTRFWKTFINLIFRPGFLTEQFFAGRRIRYAPPMRFFIFASFVLFLLLQIFTNRQLNSVLYGPVNQDENVEMDSVEIAVADSAISGTPDEIHQELAENLPDNGVLKFANSNIELDLSELSDARTLKDALDVLAQQMEQNLATETDPEKRAKLIEYINLARSPQQVVTRLLKYLSWAFFLLLPVFALILKLFYVRRKQYYIRHLIFSIHFHSFIFLMFILITLLNGVFDRNTAGITIIFLLIIPVYFFIALKKFYGQGIGKVMLKFLGISVLYNIILGVTIGVVFLNALSII